MVYLVGWFFLLGLLPRFHSASISGATSRPEDKPGRSASFITGKGMEQTTKQNSSHKLGDTSSSVNDPLDPLEADLARMKSADQSGARAHAPGNAVAPLVDAVEEEADIMLLYGLIRAVEYDTDMGMFDKILRNLERSDALHDVTPRDHVITKIDLPIAMVAAMERGPGATSNAAGVKKGMIATDRNGHVQVGVIHETGSLGKTGSVGKTGSLGKTGGMDNQPPAAPPMVPEPITIN